MFQIGITHDFRIAAMTINATQLHGWRAVHRRRVGLDVT